MTPPPHLTPSFPDFDRKATAGHPLSIVFFGGSLTWGANATDPNLTSYRGLMGQYLRQKYPRSSFTFHDAAIGGTGSKLGMFRLQRDVLSRQPDLVFLDFTVNDGIDDDDAGPLDSYECLLREMIGANIPILQVMLGVKHHFVSTTDDLPARCRQHMRLAEAYHTGTAIVFPHIRRKLAGGDYTVDQLWPFDGTHPDDPGYRLFFEAVRDGFDQAIAETRVCKVPPKPVYSDHYRQRQRIRLIDQPLPQGWRREKTYRTSLWFDGLSSRWMDDVAMCSAHDGKAIEPLRVEFSGTFLGIFGEADQNGLSFRATVDGKPLMHDDDSNPAPSDVWPFSTRHLGQGRLFVWKELTSSLPPGRHTIEILPIIDPANDKGELRIESICVAGE